MYRKRIDAIFRGRRGWKAVWYHLFSIGKYAICPINTIWVLKGDVSFRIRGARRRSASREKILPEEELLRMDGVPSVRSSHVLIDLPEYEDQNFKEEERTNSRNWDIKIKTHAQGGSSQQDNKDRKGRIFKIGELYFHRSKLNTPADC
jgi:hypothetical protein